MLNDYALAPATSIVGGLVDQTGKAITAVTITVSPIAAPFDPREVFFAALRDVDGTKYETPPILEGEGPAFPRARPVVAARPEFGGPAYSASFSVRSKDAPGFRVWVFARNPGVPVAVTVRFKQA